MERHEVLILQIFRTTPGDTVAKDWPLAGGEELGSSIETAKSALASYFNDKHIPGKEKPTQAHLVGEDGRIVARFRMEPSGAKQVG